MDTRVNSITSPTETVARNWLDGDWADSADHRDSFDPATGRKIGTYAHASREDMGRAIAAAVRAFRTTPWKHDRHLRARVLNAMADHFEKRRVHLIDLLALDNGKVKFEAAFELDFVPPGLRFNAALTLAEYGRGIRGGAGARLDGALTAPAYKRVGRL
jgi:betaine-aldehyde dehydrogenase